MSGPLLIEWQHATAALLPSPPVHTTALRLKIVITAACKGGAHAVRVAAKVESDGSTNGL